MTAATRPALQGNRLLAGRVIGILHKATASTAFGRLKIVVGLLVLWQIGVGLTKVSPLILPSPLEVLRVWAGDLISGELIKAVGGSLKVLTIGLVIGFILALLLVSLASTSKTGREFLEAVTAMFNPLPAIALLPLALLWFGIGPRALIFVIVHSVLWPVAVNAYAGVSAVPPTLRAVGLNLGLRRWRLVCDILLPAAFPYLLSGLKIGWAFSWRTVIAAELVFGVAGGQGGLGWFIYTKRYYLATADVFAGLLTIVLIGILVEHFVFDLAESKTVVRWGVKTH